MGEVVGFPGHVSRDVTHVTRDEPNNEIPAEARLRFAQLIGSIMVIVDDVKELSPDNFNYVWDLARTHECNSGRAGLAADMLFELLEEMASNWGGAA
ncbi:hypothetical protein JJB09_18515 [Rhizobium sp. KVB221]|uniref:Uncharacterized protein n=1 Tax=Rhizobium setariae TaxID=2801340 RepID=A0A937CQK0_9HYPH|nr:hypothetical protein [Rhizobium setariae]MBL0374018.1 hypothetical protein [Rhizobium setariae]